MSESDRSRVPPSLLEACVVIGPGAWCEDLVDDARSVTLLPAADLFPPPAPADPDVTAAACPLVLLHGDAAAGAAGSTRLLEDLRTILVRAPEALVLLVHEGVDEALATALFRAGLFDAVRSPVSGERWRLLAARVAARREQVAASRLSLEGGDDLHRRLHAHRRRLGRQIAQVGEELVQAQERLEEANRELTEHMAQLSLLYRFGRELSAARNWDATLRNILQNLAGFAGYGGAALILRSAPGGPLAPRQTYRWEESAWDRILACLDGRLAPSENAREVAPGVFRLSREVSGRAGRARSILALPLEHQGLRLGFLLLLDQGGTSVQGQEIRHLPFLQAVQVILGEEVASAQMLDRIREMGAFNARVLETVRSAIWVLDPGGATIYCNRTAREFLTGRREGGLSVADVAAGIGRGRGGRRADLSLSLFASTALRDAAQPELVLDAKLRLPGVGGPLLAHLVGADEEPYRGEGQILQPGGEAVPVLLHASTMPGRAPGERWLVLVAEDLRETKKLEAERRRVARLEGLVEMSATLAHEIRNPLAGLSAQAELLAEQLPPADQRKRYIDVITSEVERINGTINRLLNFVRPYEPQRAETDLATVAGDCLELVRPRAEEKQVVLELVRAPAAAEPATWRAQLDGGQIKQVLLNLLLNAVDASPAGGRVRLLLEQTDRLELRDERTGTSQQASGYLLEVRDEGPGFAPADHARIFQPFFTTKSTGTGLGLSLSRKIIDAHGGDIAALRTAGETRFRVQLPNVTGAPARRAQQEAS